MNNTETNASGSPSGTGRPSPPATSKDAKEQSRKRKRIALVLLLLLLLALGSCTTLHFCGNQRAEEATVAVMPDLDANAEDITDREGLESAMQQKADANYFSLQVNPDAFFSSQSGEGAFELINPETNVYPISFSIVLDGSGQRLYQSGTIMPNKQIRSITLDQPLDPGDHPATVIISIYNQDTHEKEGETRVKTTLHAS
ncbi:hypothetical protein [Raoultibacter phocaeensis]|uniref:hypothetical protein n=1 Tax=Raoultibacter phocaeensis TaxID=2479841 RepID=UPI001118B9BE|nr:hypothetical protein [Raoultibacter phocaeensis]